MRGHVLGLWVFSAALVGFLGVILYLTFQGQHLAVQRLGSAMVFVGTLSAFELINDRRKLATRRERGEIKRLKSQLADTRRWSFSLQSALRRLNEKQDMDLETALQAKREVDATFARLEKRMQDEERDSEEELETIDLHAGLNTIFLLGFGTLIWGYGDLASSWLARFLAAP